MKSRFLIASFVLSWSCATASAQTAARAAAVPYSAWGPAFTNLANWGYTAQGMQAGAGPGSGWAALPFMPLGQDVAPVALVPLIRQLNAYKPAERRWVQEAMLNLGTMSSADLRSATKKTDIARLMQVLELARYMALPEALKQATQLMDEQVRRPSEPVGDMRKMKRRIGQLSKLAKDFMGFELYDGGVPDLSTELAGKIDGLQTAWNKSWGGPLELDGVVVLTPGTSFERKGLRLQVARSRAPVVRKAPPKPVPSRRK